MNALVNSLDSFKDQNNTHLHTQNAICLTGTTNALIVRLRNVGLSLHNCVNTNWFVAKSILTLCSKTSKRCLLTAVRLVVDPIYWAIIINSV
jgi:hypothetical protein